MASPTISYHLLVYATSLLALSSRQNMDASHYTSSLRLVVWDKKLAAMIATKHSQSYSQTLNWLYTLQAQFLTPQILHHGITLIS